MSRFTERDIRLLRALDGPLPFVPRPFADVAERAGLEESEVLDQIRAWLEDGTIRRFGARVDHLSLGFTSNGMSVWAVPGDRVDAVAEIMVQQTEVSHCYQRARRPGWPYNLFAMIHGEHEDDVRAVAQRIAEAADLDDYDVLFSTKEFKKSVPRYFSEKE